MKKQNIELSSRNKRATKKTMETRGANGTAKSSSGEFLEFSAAQFFGGTQSSAVIEVTRGDGARMVMRFEDSADFDTEGLVAAFLDQEL